MVFTEIKTRNEKKYYYRVLSVRNKNKISKKRKYLGANLSKEELKKKENQADKELKINSKKKEDILNKIKPKIIEILKKNKVKKAGIFGSYARGDYKKNSDIDIVVESPKGLGFGFVGIQFDLEDGLKRKVDLVTYNSLHPLLKERILEEEIKII